jgi:hypothetical protein
VRTETDPVPKCYDPLLLKYLVRDRITKPSNSECPSEPFRIALTLVEIVILQKTAGFVVLKEAAVSNPDSWDPLRHVPKLL